MNRLNQLLLVDDDSTMAMTTRWTVEEVGVTEIIEARNGQLALEWLTQQPQVPDLIILDLQMPVMDGIGFLEAISLVDHLASLKDRIVVLTSMQLPRMRKQVEALGVKWYVTRPLTTNVILAILAELPNGSDGQSVGIST